MQSAKYSSQRTLMGNNSPAFAVPGSHSRHFRCLLVPVEFHSWEVKLDCLGAGRVIPTMPASTLTPTCEVSLFVESLKIHIPPTRHPSFTTHRLICLVLRVWTEERCSLAKASPARSPVQQRSVLVAVSSGHSIQGLLSLATSGASTPCSRTRTRFRNVWPRLQHHIELAAKDNRFALGTPEAY